MQRTKLVILSQLLQGIGKLVWPYPKAVGNNVYNGVAGPPCGSAKAIQWQWVGPTLRVTQL